MELFINCSGGSLEDQYQGVYVFMERITVSEFRVNVTPLLENETMEPEISGGYILKIDNPLSGDEYFTTDRGTRIFYFYPSGNQMEDIKNQSAWIKNYMDEFEAALAGPNFTDPIDGYAKYIDVDSFVDYIILNELFKNGEAFSASMYMHKDRGGKLKMGPIWDYNGAMGNFNSYTLWNDFKAWDSKDWATVLGPRTFWFERLLEDDNFSNKVISRWNELRTGIFSLQNITSIIDNYTLLLNESKERNFQKWPILGRYIWANPPPFPKTYEQEINRFKNWFEGRIKWIDDNINYIHGIKRKSPPPTELLWFIPPFDGSFWVLIIILGMVITPLILIVIYGRKEILAVFLEIRRTNIRELFGSISKEERDKNTIIVKRYELKYYINHIEYEYLSNVLSKVLKLDPHSKGGKGYLVRSVYFDNEENKALYEKLAGVETRKKYRIRMYDLNPNIIKFEIKNKVSNEIVKESALIKQEDVAEIIKGNYELLLKYNNKVLNKIFYEFKKFHYIPKTKIDYRRIAYYYNINNIRITFDKMLGHSETKIDFFNPEICRDHSFQDNKIILEIKYDHFLPDYIKNILQLKTFVRSAISKYTQSRRIE